jgi:predicted MFS family arabinose efflux permease
MSDERILSEPLAGSPAPQAPVFDTFAVKLSAMLTAVCLMVYYSSMPIILGRAAESRGLLEVELGYLGGSFAAGVTLASFVSIVLIRRLPWRRLVLISSVGAAFSFLAPLWVDGFSSLLFFHVLAGVSCGIGYSVAIACLGHGSNPTRNYALCFVLQTLVGIVVSYSLPRFTNAENSYDQALMLLAAFAVVAAMIGQYLPKSLPVATARASRVTTAFPLAIFSALFVIFLIYAGDGAVWAFAERIAIHGGLTAEQAGTGVGWSLFAGTIGSLSAAIMGNRWGFTLPMTIAVLASILSVVWLSYFDSDIAFMCAIALNGWAWNFGSGFRMGLVATLDRTGRFTPLITGMQLLGTTAGTTVAGLLVVGGDFKWVYLFASMLWVVGMIIFAIVVKTSLPDDR